MTIGEYIRQLRKMKKLTLKQLAQEIGLSYTYLSQIELGDRNASPEILENLSNYLDVPYSDLMEKAGFLEERSILQKALEAQAELINNIRGIKEQIIKLESDLIEENGEVISRNKIDYNRISTKTAEVLRNYLAEMKVMLKILNDKIGNYSNPNVEKGEIESNIKSILSDIRSHSIKRDAFLTSINMVRSSFLMNEQEREEVINFIEEYLAKENDPHFSDFEEYSQKKGFDLYKTINKEQMENFYQFFLEGKKLKMKRSESINKSVKSISGFDSLKDFIETAEKDSAIINTINCKESILDLDYLLRSKEDIYYKGEKLEKDKKEQVLKMLEVLFPDTKYN